MACGAGSNLSALLQSQKGPCVASNSQPLDAFFLYGSSSSFLDSRSMMSFEDAQQVNGSTRPFLRPFGTDEIGDDEFDKYNFHQPEKKRRLTIDQVQFLEKNFELEDKLEPERKIQLAKDLGLQPRQVAIWFQNRRARWKTKQLEKDYQALLSSYNSLKANYDTLIKEKDKLKAQIDLLTSNINAKESEKESLELTEKHNALQERAKKGVIESVSEEETRISSGQCKQEDNSSNKSDILDSDSPHYTDGVHSSFIEAASFIEAGDSSYIFEPEQSDLSQDEEDNLGKSLLPLYAIFPKLEDVDYTDPPPPTASSFEVDHHAFWSWSY